jgi:hypothetical protein
VVVHKVENLSTISRKKYLQTWVFVLVGTVDRYGTVLIRQILRFIDSFPHRVMVLSRICKDPKLSAGPGIVVSGPERTVTVRKKDIGLFFADAKRFFGPHIKHGVADRYGTSRA